MNDNNNEKIEEFDPLFKDDEYLLDLLNYVKLPRLIYKIKSAHLNINNKEVEIRVLNKLTKNLEDFTISLSIVKKLQKKSFSKNIIILLNTIDLILIFYFGYAKNFQFLDLFLIVFIILLLLSENIISSI